MKARKKLVSPTLEQLSTRDKYYRKKYGITLEQYNNMLSYQKGNCAICEEVPKENKNGVVVRLSVDHNHKTGKVRGLLCYKCNKLLLGRIERMYKQPVIVAQGLYDYLLTDSYNL